MDESGKQLIADNDLDRLRVDLLEAVKHSKVALGFEAPMWVPLPKVTSANEVNTFDFQMTERFPSEKNAGTSNNQYQWYQGGAAASLKAIVVAEIIFGNKKVFFQKNSTKDPLKWGINENEYRIFLFEGFGAGRYKPIQTGNQNYADAFSIASACLYSVSSYSLNSSPKEYLEVRCDERSCGIGIREIKTNINKNTINKEYTSHKGIICLWEKIFNESITGPIGCNIYGFEGSVKSFV